MASSRTTTTTFLWRRLDAPGHDACQFLSGPDGHTLRGTAVFMEAKRICALQYEVIADSAFRTRRARVTGSIGKDLVDLRVRGNARAEWTINGAEQPSLAGCVDLDLGFTPATNLLPLRRLALRVGEEAQAPAAYLAFPRIKFHVLPQRYKRLSRTEYDYESPTAGYRGTLQVGPNGVVLHYPGLFMMEPAG
jgi:hypothetical protein